MQLREGVWCWTINRGNKVISSPSTTGVVTKKKHVRTAWSADRNAPSTVLDRFEFSSISREPRLSR